MSATRRGILIAMASCCLAGVVGQSAAVALYAISLRRLEAVDIHDGGRRVLAAPLSLTIGDALPLFEIEDHLRRLGYYDSETSGPGTYSQTPDSLTIHSRFAELPSLTIRWAGDRVVTIHDLAGRALHDASVEPETLRAWDVGMDGLEHEVFQLPAPIAALRESAILDALIASEEGRFHEQHGLDLVRLIRASVNGTGASTLAMQVARQTVLHERRRTLPRKLAEIGLAMAIDRKYSKDEILSAYASRIYLGTVSGVELRGFAAAARELLGISDLRQLTLSQAATLVAMLNRPDGYIAEVRAGNAGPVTTQRDRVLRLIGTRFSERYPPRVIEDAKAQAVAFTTDSALRRHQFDAAYFLDHSLPMVSGKRAGRVYLTVDGRYQRAADAAVAAGAGRLDARLGGSSHSPIQIALIAVDVRTGDVRAMVGGRSYELSQFNRATMGSRQVGSLVKPYGYLTAFERGADEGLPLSPNTIVLDVPTVFRFGGKPWSPRNYGNQYGGSITWRSALAQSKNVAAVKVSGWAGFQRLARLWSLATGRTAGAVYPSFALGATEATPAQVAQAYTAFANGGVVTPLRFVKLAVDQDRMNPAQAEKPFRIVRIASAQSVTEMMRAVFDTGTARGARQRGFVKSAAGKTGTTDDQRDAWFAGFSKDLLTVVWVGRDDNSPLGLTGGEAALPIWTDFMLAVGRGPRWQ